jgi:hypothetical protein
MTERKTVINRNSLSTCGWMAAMIFFNFCATNNMQLNSRQHVFSIVTNLMPQPSSGEGTPGQGSQGGPALTRTRRTRRVEKKKKSRRPGRRHLDRADSVRLYVSLQRKASRPPTTEELRTLIEDYMSWEVVTNTEQSVLLGIDLAEKYRSSFWDALIVQAAETAGASILYSEDMSNGQTYGSVQVMNPFSDPGVETRR